MSSPAVLLLILMLEDRAVPQGNGREFQVRCEDGKLAPPVIAELRAHDTNVANAQALSTIFAPLPIRTRDIDEFAAPALTRPNLVQRQENAEACFG